MWIQELILLSLINSITFNSRHFQAIIGIAFGSLLMAHGQGGPKERQARTWDGDWGAPSGTAGRAGAFGHEPTAEI